MGSLQSGASRQPRVADELLSFPESSLSGQHLNVGGESLYLFIFQFLFCTQTFSFDVRTPCFKRRGLKIK